MNIDESCSLCCEIHNLPNNNIPKNFFGARFDRIIKKSDNFLIVPSLGQIVEGYLLILTKYHYLSMSHLPIEYYDELKSLIDTARDIIKKLYDKKVIIFEHGMMCKERRAGACVDHAHLNIVPCNEDISSLFYEKLEFKSLSSIEELKRQYYKDKPYLYYCSPTLQQMSASVPNYLPSQYVRKILAKEVYNTRRWDWKIYPGKEQISLFLNKFKNSDFYEEAYSNCR